MTKHVSVPIYLSLLGRAVNWGFRSLNSFKAQEDFALRCSSKFCLCYQLIECIMQGTSAKHKRKVAPSLHPPFHTSVINTSLISETCAALKIEMLPEKHTDHAVHSRFGLRQRTLCVYLSQRSHFTQTHAYLSTAHQTGNYNTPLRRQVLFYRLTAVPLLEVLWQALVLFSLELKVFFFFLEVTLSVGFSAIIFQFPSFTKPNPPSNKMCFLNYHHT